MQIDYELSYQLKSPDDHGVRCAAPVVDGGAASGANSDDNNKNDGYRIIIGNQMGILYEWKLLPSVVDVIPISYQHDHAITALLSSSSSLLSNDTTDNNIYITGCKDSKIRIFNSLDHTIQATLIGHEKPVTSLSWVYVNGNTNNKRYLVSGSWDGTAKIWDLATNAVVATLAGHENSVCVVGLVQSSSTNNSNESSTNLQQVLYVATGSAGMAMGSQIRGQSVRIWQITILTGSAAEVTMVHQVANDHDGPIRDIAIINNIDRIVTCSNDGTLKIRTATDGTSIATLPVLSFDQPNEQPPILLSVRFVDRDDNNNTATIVTAAEDGNVIIYTCNNDTYEQTQFIRHPQTVWNIVPLPNGDFGTCCQDGSFRIFTRNPERVASDDEKEVFAKEVSTTLAAQQSGPSDSEIAKLPLWEQNHSHRGSSEGAVQIFNKNGTAIAAQWSATSQTWIEVGEVVGRPGANNNDNTNENTIDGVRYDYVFPIEVDGAGGTVVTLQIGYNIGENQFVAAQRFIDTHSLPQYHLSEIADYIQQRTSSASHRTIGGGGSSGGASTAHGATTGVPIASYEHIPSKHYKSFDLPKKNAATTIDKMKQKIIEFNILSSATTSEASLDTVLAALLQNCQTSSISDDGIEIIATMLETSPPANIFPVLDIVRLLVLHTDASSTTKRLDIWKLRIIPKVIELCQNLDSYNLNEVDHKVAITAIPLLSIRLFANCFVVSSSLNTIFGDYLDSILSCISLHIKSNNKNIRASVTTVIHNICHYIFDTKVKKQISNPVVDGVGVSIVSISNQIIDNRSYEMDSLYLLFVGLGTIIMADTLAKDAAKSLYLATKVEPAAFRFSTSNQNIDAIKTAAKEIYSLLA